MPLAGRIANDTNVSGAVQGDLGQIIGRLEGLLAQRDAQVAAAMSDFEAEGVSEDYHAVEQRWRKASDEVRSIIALVKSTMARNDETALATQGRAKTAVANIG